jgi:TPR repeat protein
VLSLARVLERASDHERSQVEYQRALEACRPGVDDGVRRASLARLASRAKRGGDLLAAVTYWQQAVEAGEIEAFRELAVLHEHYRRDLTAALEVVEDGLAFLRDAPTTSSRVWRDLNQRRDRLRRRLAKGVSRPS